MYIPHAYKNENLSEVRNFIKENSFAILISQVDGAPWATHLPLELMGSEEEGFKLVGHLAKANPQWKSLEENPKVLAVFHGPHSYVSSSWYKEEEVPTWNYIAVHIYGRVKLQDDEQLYKSLDRLVNRYEQHSEDPVSMKNLSKRTLRQIRAVVGFEIEIDKIEAAYKLSQGRPEDHSRIIAELESKTDPGSQAIAEIMKDQDRSQ